MDLLLSRNQTAVFRQGKTDIFTKKTQHNKNIKEQFYLSYLAQNLQELFCSLLKFSTTSKEKNGILIHLMSCTASDMWKEAPEISTKNQSA